jgi:hypothetical protein
LGRHGSLATTSEEVDRAQPDVGTRPDFRPVPLFFVLFFPLFSIVSAPTAFLSPLQHLALQLARIFPL